jgi:hypothetical protein
MKDPAGQEPCCDRGLLPIARMRSPCPVPCGKVHDVGRWTVEMLLIFTLGRPDFLPVGDFGVRGDYLPLKPQAM